MENTLKKQTEIVLKTLSKKLDMSLIQLVFFYTANDEFKDLVDGYLKQINTIRKGKKINMNDYINSLAEQE